MKIHDTLECGNQAFENWLNEGTKTDVTIALQVYALENRFKECRFIVEFLEAKYNYANQY